MQYLIVSELALSFNKLIAVIVSISSFISHDLFVSEYCCQVLLPAIGGDLLLDIVSLLKSSSK
jgi:hypothetical protein